ncbi:MAG: hypothetical protein IPH20_07640, partial [Bacteroidales bacterium]|nr:hypothetical protein [Bacteroidales bacterium]
NKRMPVVLDSYYSIAGHEEKYVSDLELNTQIKLFDQFSDSLRIDYAILPSEKAAD